MEIFTKVNPYKNLLYSYRAILPLALVTTLPIAAGVSLSSLPEGTERSGDLTMRWLRYNKFQGQGGVAAKVPAHDSALFGSDRSYRNL